MKTLWHPQASSWCSCSWICTSCLCRCSSTSFHISSDPKNGDDGRSFGCPDFWEARTKKGEFVGGSSSWKGNGWFLVQASVEIIHKTQRVFLLSTDFLILHSGNGEAFSSDTKNLCFTCIFTLVWFIIQLPPATKRDERRSNRPHNNFLL